jgi:hypothetical protein
MRQVGHLLGIASLHWVLDAYGDKVWWHKHGTNASRGVAVRRSNEGYAWQTELVEDVESSVPRAAAEEPAPFGDYEDEAHAQACESVDGGADVRTGGGSLLAGVERARARSRDSARGRVVRRVGGCGL